MEKYNTLTIRPTRSPRNDIAQQDDSPGAERTPANQILRNNTTQDNPPALPESSYSPTADQFNQMVLIATFTAAVILAAMSLFNELLTKLNYPLYYRDKKSGKDFPTSYGLGMIFGIIALVINVGIAMMASVNGALSRTKKGRVLPMTFLSILQIGGMVTTGVSLILFTFAYQLDTGWLVTIIYGISVLLSLFHLRHSVPWENLRKNKGIAILSCLISTAVLACAVAHFDRDAYFIIPLYFITICYHLTVLKSLKHPKSKVQLLLLYTVCPLVLAAWWLGTIPIVRIWTLFFLIPKLVLVSIEALILLVVAFLQNESRKTIELSPLHTNIA